MIHIGQGKHILIGVDGAQCRPGTSGIVGGIGNLESSIAVSSLGGYSLSNKYRNLIEDEAERLKTEEACDIIVVSIHNGDLSLTSKGAKYINAVFEGHTHENYAYNDEYGIPHVQCYSNGSDIQQVSFRVNSDGELVLKQPSSQDPCRKKSGSRRRGLRQAVC